MKKINFLMSLLYKLAHNLFLWVVPILIVFYSISFVLPNGEMQKKTLRDADYYNKLSSQLQADTQNPDNLNVQQSVQGLITSSVVGGLVTPQWLQNLTERNIDLTSRWFGGQEQDWALFLPTEEINKTVSEKLDEKTTNFVNLRRSEVRVCSEAETEQIKKSGFDLAAESCLPKEVVDGQSSLTDFLAIKGESFKDNFLSVLVKDNQLNTLSDQFKVDRLGTAQSQLQGRLNYVRDWSIWARQVFWIAILVILVLLAADLILAKAANRTIYNETQRLSLYTGFSTLGLSLTVLMILGGSVYLTSFVNQLLLPGLLKSEAMNLILQLTVRLAFNLISYAVWVGGGLVLVSLVMRLAKSLGWLGNTALKNQKLQKSSVLNTNNTTLDGQFRASLQNKVGLPSTQGFDEPVSSQNFDMPLGSGALPVSTFNQDAISMANTQTIKPPESESQKVKGEAIDPQNAQEYFDYGFESLPRPRPEVATPPPAPNLNLLLEKPPAKNLNPVILPTIPPSSVVQKPVIGTNPNGPKVGGL
jgi:hypothetical protein